MSESDLIREEIKDIPNAFMDVCRDNMTKAKFQSYLDEAKRRVAVGNQLPASEMV